MNLRRLHLMLSALLALFLSIFVTSGPAEARGRGGFDGGGADPLAIEFMRAARIVRRWVKEEKIQELKGIDAEAIDAEIDVIQQSLDGKEPRLRFVPGKTLDCFGVQKLGCVNDDRTIDIAREGWEQAHVEAQFQTVALEFFRLLEVPGRYHKADLVGQFARDNFNYTSPHLGTLAADVRTEFQEGDVQYISGPIARPFIETLHRLGAGFEVDEKLPKLPGNYLLKIRDLECQYDLWADRDQTEADRYRCNFTPNKTTNKILPPVERAKAERFLYELLRGMNARGERATDTQWYFAFEFNCEVYYGAGPRKKNQKPISYECQIIY